jgi:hypothetical protein
VVRVERIDSLPPANARGQLSLGRPVSLAVAHHVANFRLLLPAVGAPDQVFVANAGPDAVPGGVVSLVYGQPRHPRLLVQEFLGRSPGPELLKQVRPTTPVERVTFDGRPALWFGGAHSMSFVDADGMTRGSRMLLVGKTLVFLQDDVTIRIEGRFDRRRALELAKSFR